MRSVPGAWCVLEVFGQRRDDDPPLDGIVLRIRDITAQKRAETALHQRSETLRALSDASPVAIVVEDPQGKVTMWSAAAESLFGWTSAEILGRANPMVPHDCEDEHRRLRERVLQGESFKTLETVRQHKDGSMRQVSLSTALLRDPGGSPRGVMEILQDVTERSELENQLRQAQKMDALGRLAGGLAHDFNNIMTAIGGYAAMIATHLGKPSEPTAGDVGGRDRGAPPRTIVAAHEITRAVERARALTHGMLAFTRNQVLQPTTLDLGEVVESMNTMLRPLIGEQIELVTPTPRDLGLVRADRSQIEQVLLNLAVNARAAMPNGGRLTIETAVVQLEDTYARQRMQVVPGRYVQLTVSDNGVGLDSKTKARIFEPFFSTKPQGEGTGLGLSMVYGIVKQTGGYIWVDSEPGHGTTFTVHVPRVEGTARPDSTSPKIDRMSLTGSEAVLVVEDEEMVRTLVRHVLSTYGYQVLEARNGEEALREADGRAQPIHLMLTDIIMPGMSAIDLVEQMEARHPQTKIMCMSGYTDLAARQYGLLLRRVPFMPKPFTPDRLAHKVRQVLDSASTPTSSRDETPGRQKGSEYEAS